MKDLITEQHLAQVDQDAAERFACAEGLRVSLREAQGKQRVLHELEQVHVERVCVLAELAIHLHRVESEGKAEAVHRTGMVREAVEAREQRTDRLGCVPVVPLALDCVTNELA